MSYADLSAYQHGAPARPIGRRPGDAAHGAQKLFGWFVAASGPHASTAESTSNPVSRYEPGRPFALLAGIGEFTSGLLVALGACSGSRWAPA